MAEIVSNFELIFKPQSPSEPSGTAAVATVLQGYFLAITNLEDQAYDYLLEFISVDPSASATVTDIRELDDNNIFLVDTPDGNNTPGRVRSFGSEVHTPTTGRITIPAQGTALAVLLPQVFPIPAGDDATPLSAANFEGRGYVRIRLPANFERVPFDNPFTGFESTTFFPRPQSSEPVRVLVTPQYRATYTDADGTITDQTQSTVPTGSGSAVVTIEPDRGLLTLGSLERNAFSADISSLLDQLPEDTRTGLLAGLLAQMPEDDKAMKAINAALKATDAKVALKKS